MDFIIACIILSSWGWDCLNLPSLRINVAFLKNCSERNCFILKTLETYCAFFLALLWFWSGEGRRSEAWRFFSSLSVWLHLRPSTWDIWHLILQMRMRILPLRLMSDWGRFAWITDRQTAWSLATVSKTGWSLWSLIWLKCATSGQLCSNSVLINCNNRLCW